MRDPYEVLGVKRGADLDEIKAAYRQTCKARHPDLGGSHEAMVELNTAYAFILNEIKEGYQRQEKQARAQTTAEEAWSDVGEAKRDDKRDNRWRDIYRDIDEELESLRRAAEQYDEQLRTMRRAAWQTGRRTDWAKLTWDDLVRFFTRAARSGLKGVALLFAALVGVGSMLVEANLVSAIIMLGSVSGFALSLALRSDKGGMLSASLLLFGVMTVWLPPVRNALLLFPVATISVLILLALIFKFAQAGGTFGFMTGGVLALYVIAVIVGDTSRQSTGVTTAPSSQAPIATQAARSTPTPAPSPSSAALRHRPRLRCPLREPSPLRPSPGRSSRPTVQSSSSSPAFRTT